MRVAHQDVHRLVRTLAQRSSASSRDIESMIQNRVNRCKEEIIAAPTHPAYDGGSDTHVLTRNCYSFSKRSQVIVRSTDNSAKATSCDFSNAAQHEYAGCDLYSMHILKWW